MIQSILHAHLIPPCPHGNLVGVSGRKWITKQHVPVDERLAIERHLCQIERSLDMIEAEIAKATLSDPVIRRLMTLPGVDMTVATGVGGCDQGYSSPPRSVEASRQSRFESERSPVW